MNLEDEIRKAAAALPAPAGRRRKQTTALALVAKPVERVEKSFSLVPVDQAINVPLRSMPRPGDQAILRATNESPWLHIKVMRLASAFASIPFFVGVEAADGERTQLPRAHPMWLIMKKPNPILSGWHFRFLTELYARTVGSCYWRVGPGGLGVPATVWVLPPNWVIPIRDAKGMVVEYQVQSVFSSEQGGVRTERVPAKQMIWLTMPDPMDPYAKGVGDALSLATEVDTFELASESDRRFFENDATPAGALIVPGRIDKDERDKISDDWQAKHGGPRGQGTVPILFGGMDFKTFRTGRKEMDFVEGQRYLRDVIIAGVHKHVLGISDEVNFAAAKAADYQVGKWELLPRTPWWEEYATRLAQMFDQRVIVWWDNPVPVDETIATQKSNDGFVRGAITRNEWRETNGYPVIDDPVVGDIFIMQPGFVEVPLDGSPPRQPVPPASPFDEPRGPAAVQPEDRPEGRDDKTTKPIGPYEDFAECVAANQDKRDPEAYCAAIEQGKDVSKWPLKVVVPKAVEVKVALDPLHPNFRRVLQQISTAFKDSEASDTLRPIYEAIMSGRIADVKGELGIDVKIDVSDPTLLHYLREVAGTRIRRVNDTTRDQIREQLSEAALAGEKLSQIEERISSVFAEAKESRAEVIARTETIDASNATAYATYERSQVVEQVEWLLAGDYDAEEDDGDCAEVEASGPVPLGQPFANGHAWPPAHPNCRCTVAPIVFDEEDAITRGLRWLNAKWGFRWTDDARTKQRSHLMADHSRQIRLFQSKMKRVFQEQQNSVLRMLRANARGE